MSLILDALSRAEQERRSEETTVPDLLMQAPVEPEGTSRWLPALLAAVAVLGVAALILIWRPWAELSPQDLAPSSSPDSPSSSIDSKSVVGRESTAVSDPQTIGGGAGTGKQLQGRGSQPTQASNSDGDRSAADTGTAVAMSEAPGTASSAVAGSSQGVSGSESIAALYAASKGSPKAAANRARDNSPDQSDAESIATQRLNRETQFAVGAAESAPGEERSGESLAAAPRTAAPKEEELDVEAILREVQREAAAIEGADEHPVPLLADQSKQFRDSVPTLMYLRHDYQGSRNSTVYLNGESLRVGQRTRNVEVREILPDFVVLRFQDTEFRLRALNSWVNL
ncbi:MAG: general secretion pathway protein GspB [Pseudomonadota bacterium]